MAGIFQGDIIIKTAIELGIEDMRKNPWLVDHMLSDLIRISYFTDKYGQSQIDACKEWFKNNQIDVYMRGREDKDRYPCITIQMLPSNEKEDMKTMGDASTETVTLLPNEIGKPIPYVMKPFTPTGYDSTTGEISFDPATTGFDAVAVGMVLVDPINGQGFAILDISDDSIFIEPNIQLDAPQLAVVPKFAYYEARVEHTFFQEMYQVGCHAHGDPQTLLWLHSIALYSLLRYRESLLEANGFAQSVITNGGMDDNANFEGPGGEKVYTRTIMLNGQVEQTFIKSPRRFIESVVLKQPTTGGTGPNGTGTASQGYVGGIEILSNLDTPDFIDQSEQVWNTIEDDES